MASALFIDGAYLMKATYPDKSDLIKLRNLVEQDAGEVLDEAYYFSAADDSTKQVKFVAFMQYPPPSGPGLRVKMYWITHKKLFWPAEHGGGPVVHPSDLDPGTGQPLQYELTMQKAVDVGLAFHMVRSYYARKWNRLYLVAGDSDFYEPVMHLVENENVELVLIGNGTTVSTRLRQFERKFMDISIAPLLAQVLK